jgi:hypothetical protein
MALTGLRSAKSDVLYLESGYSGTRPTIDRGHPCAAATEPGSIHVAEATSMRYRVDVEVECPSWLFLADADYPGWRASVNGVTQPIFTGQCLGKAISLRPGRNQVVVTYEPRAFRRGATISLLTLVTVLLSLAGRQVRGFFCARRRVSSATHE